MATVAAMFLWVLIAVEPVRPPIRHHAEGVMTDAITSSRDCSFTEGGSSGILSGGSALSASLKTGLEPSAVVGIERR